MQNTYSQKTYSFIRRISLVPAYIICGLVAILVLIPVLTTAIGGLRTTAELVNTPFSLPTALHWENYGTILAGGSFWQELGNSLISTLGTLGLQLLVACPAAFVFARISFPGREIIFNILLLGFLFPLAVAVLPLYITLRNLNLLDSLVGIILPQAAFALPLTVLILRNFFRAVPGELEDSAYIDGCSPLGFFWYILLPLSRPALAAVAMISMVGSWNSFLLPLLVLNSSQLWTLPLGVTQFQGQFSTNWALVMAFATLSLIPAIIFYLFAERHLVAGLTGGAVKG